MPLPTIYDTARKYLFADADKMRKEGVVAEMANHILRLRDLYNYWLEFPSKKDRDIVTELKSRYNISTTVAREDLRLIKTLLGDLQKNSKDYTRYRFTEMIMRAYDLAAKKENTRDMVAAAAQFAKYMQLDKDDERANIIDRVTPIVLSFTDDPAVIGITRLPNFRERIKNLKERYWTEQTQEVEFEEIDARIDDIFKPPLINAPQDSAGLSE